jgi:hypothetical protein
MENRNGLCVDVRGAPATGYAERDEALEMLRRLRRRGYDPKTLAGDKGYCLGDFPQRVLDLGIKGRDGAEFQDVQPIATRERTFPGRGSSRPSSDHVNASALGQPDAALDSVGPGRLLKKAASAPDSRDQGPRRRE